MTKPGYKVQPGWRYDAAEQAALDLETLLHAHGIPIAPGSAMEAHVLAVMRLVDRKAARDAPPDDVRAQYRTLVGVHELATAILATQNSNSFPSLLPHLRLLSSGNALQNMPSSGTDQVTNKLFELFAASMAIECGVDVELDHPTWPKGDNPDVLATIGGQRWGIACKVIHSLNPEGFIGHLEKGVDQIERSAAEIGVVLFNLKNVLPHEHIWPLGEVEGSPGEFATGCWSDPAAPFEILVECLDQLGQTLVSYLPENYLENTFAGKKSIPGFLLWAHSVSGVRINSRPTASSVRALNLRTLAPLDSRVEKVLKCLNWAAFVGSPGRGERPEC